MERNLKLNFSFLQCIWILQVSQYLVQKLGVSPWFSDQMYYHSLGFCSVPVVCLEESESSDKPGVSLITLAEDTATCLSSQGVRHSLCSSSKDFSFGSWGPGRLRTLLSPGWSYSPRLLVFVYPITPGGWETLPFKPQNRTKKSHYMTSYITYMDSMGMQLIPSRCQS